MKLKLVMEAFTIWLCLMMMMTAAISETSALRYNQVTWDLRQPGQYSSTFLKNLRAELSSEIVCGFPVTSKSATNVFVLVNLILTNTQKLQLALRISDGYFVGYRDIYKTEYRANFVKEEYNNLMGSTLFKEAQTYRQQLPYNSNYDNLEKVGEVKRENLNLGVPTLKKYIKLVYGVEYKSSDKPKNIGRDMARFALIAIQMVAEGARFKYIEDEINVKGIKTDFIPSPEFINLENLWGSVSEAVHKAAPTCTTIKVDNFPWAVTQVSGLRPYVSLLKFKKSTLEQEQDVQLFPFINNDVQEKYTGDGDGAGDGAGVAGADIW